MKEFKGTPGPWINVGGWVDAEKRSGELSGIICSISAVAARNLDVVNDANANLIAAAPELLEALQIIINDCSRMIPKCAEEKEIAAINKVLGE